MSLRSILLSALLSVAAHAALAQTYPTRGETPVIDDAEVIGAVEEARLAERLVELRQQTNTDIAVVTLPSTVLYTMGDDLDVYAQGLMEEWTLGDTTSDRRALLLVFRDDRELRLEVEGDFAVDPGPVAADIVETTILPRFREDDYGAGITEGIDAMAARILAVEEPAPATSAPSPAPAEGGGGNILFWIGAIVAALAGLVFAAARRSSAKLAATPCAACGKTGLTRSRVVTREPTETTEGRGETRLTCPACGHVEAEPYVIARKSTPESEKKETKKGGASGEW